MSTNPPTPTPAPAPKPTLTFDQYLAALEEWSSREQLGECVSTLRRFHASGYSLQQSVGWLELRESVLKEDDANERFDTRSGTPTLDYDDYENRGEGFGA